MKRIYYWIHHTGRNERSTGVQRVVRRLAQGLIEAGCDVVPVRWSAEQEAIIRAEENWLEGLANVDGPRFPRDAEEGVPLHLTAADAAALPDAWLLLPEVPHVDGADSPNLVVAFDYARYYGLRIAAVFYDLIPLRSAGYEAMAPDHARYASALAAADMIFPISHYSAQDLSRWWSEQGCAADRLPRIIALPLAEEMWGVPRVTVPVEPPAPPIRFLAVGTIEPRKNQLEAMRAFTRLGQRRPDLDLRLTMVGGIHGAVEREVHKAAKDDQRIDLLGYLPDGRIRGLFKASHATVFLSHNEGFGLPVVESLWQGKPCLCSDDGAIAEIGVGGGCLMVPARDPGAIERGFERLAEDIALRQRLAAEACGRAMKNWRDYAHAVRDALAAAPALRRIVLIEGSAGDVDGQARQLRDAGVGARHFHWRADSRALLPGTRAAPDLATVGAGDVQGFWAMLPTATTADAAETEGIVAVARGLGIRVALEADAGTALDRLIDADLSFFADPATRDAALERGLKRLPRTVTLRSRLRIGTGAGMLQAMDRPRLAESRTRERPRRIFYWVGTTVTQNFNTGIQRVTRLLAAALERLEIEIVPVRWDKASQRLVHISDEEGKLLAAWNGPAVRALRPLPESLAGEWLLIPEITSPVVPPGSNPAAFGRSLGMRTAAIFHDLIPEKMPEIYRPIDLANMHEFWRIFGAVDLALPVSWTAASDLCRYVADQGLHRPKIVPCTLGGDVGAVPRQTQPRPPLAPGAPLRLLAVGTREPRKNYPRLLRALAQARRKAHRPIELTIVGRRAAEFPALDAEIARLATEIGAELSDRVPDEKLLQLYQTCDATVLGSWEEGFGLPVVESLWHGRPCLCHAGSAMAEVAPGGGTLGVDMLDEASIADGLVRLADESDLLARLGGEAVTRPIRTWDDYARDVLGALTEAGAAPGWPLPAIVQRRPLLSCSITTYNRADWLAHSLPRLLDATRPWRDVIEIVVCDNASSDDTPAVTARFRNEKNFAAHRNAANVGMLGNLGATARYSRGAFIWLLGDDDLIIDGAIENVLEGIASRPEIEMVYLNYAYTTFNNPQKLADAEGLIAKAKPIAAGGPNRFVGALREVGGLNENLFTAIYACVFRRDHAMRAYQLDTRGAPFTSMNTCIPSSVYTLAALCERPAWWVGEPAIVVNMNVSWLRWVLLWHLERMPDLFQEAERRGVDPVSLDRYRLQHLTEAEKWVRAVYFDAPDEIRANFSLARLLERCKHLPEFRQRHLPGIRRVYRDAWAAGRVMADSLSPDRLFASYGVAD